LTTRNKRVLNCALLETEGKEFNLFGGRNGDPAAAQGEKTTHNKMDRITRGQRSTDQQGKNVREKSGARSAREERGGDKRKMT